MTEVITLEIPKIVNETVTRIAERHNVCFGFMFEHTLELLLIGLEYQRARTPLVWERKRDGAVIHFLPTIMIAGEIITTVETVTVINSINGLIKTLSNLVEPFAKNEHEFRREYVRAVFVLRRTEAYYRTSRLMKCTYRAHKHMRVPVDTTILPKIFQVQSRT